MKENCPESVDEAVDVLMEELCPSDRAKISEMSEEDAVSLHHTLGRWIRNNFGLWEGNADLLNDCAKIEKPSSELVNGMMHPDDASTVILKALRSRLAVKPCGSCPKFYQYNPGSSYDEPEGYVPSGRREPNECGNYLAGGNRCPHQAVWDSPDGRIVQCIGSLEVQPNAG